jgi:hypothetical protein
MLEAVAVVQGHLDLLLELADLVAEELAVQTPLVRGLEL